MQMVIPWLSWASLVLILVSAVVGGLVHEDIRWRRQPFQVGRATRLTNLAGFGMIVGGTLLFIGRYGVIPWLVAITALIFLTVWLMGIVFVNVDYSLLAMQFGTLPDSRRQQAGQPYEYHYFAATGGFLEIRMLPRPDRPADE